jgi:hypothetical protein
MSDIVITWFKSLTMEQVFVITGIGILLTGAAIGFLVEWIFRKENGRNDEDGQPTTKEYVL